MVASHLWGVDSFGKVYTLSTDSQYWELRNNAFKGRNIDFKRVSAARQCAWGLGCNQHVYVYVHNTDVPIRYQEYTYENQRWNPIHGFSARSLFPTDRNPWSNETGSRTTVEQKLFCLPSEHWSWEGDWYIDENIRGQPTGRGGWQHAVNFNANDRYTSDKKWNSCVRRRKWIRYRQYVAMDAWAKVPSLHADPVEEPFMDLAVGGYELPGQPEGFLTVWTITALGKVFCRHGVNKKCPEGVKWVEIPIKDGKGMVQISAGPTGIVWGVTWDGVSVVRIGVSRDHPFGTSWEYVQPPPDIRICQVTVGSNALWAISTNYKVWFRTEFDAKKALLDKKYATGESWVLMIGQMSSISVGPNDQVWAIGLENRLVHFRVGVTTSEPSGREWRGIELQECGLYDSSSLAESSSVGISEESGLSRRISNSSSDAKNFGAVDDYDNSRSLSVCDSSLTTGFQDAKLNTVNSNCSGTMGIKLLQDLEDGLRQLNYTEDTGPREMPVHIKNLSVNGIRNENNQINMSSISLPNVTPSLADRAILNTDVKEVKNTPAKHCERTMSWHSDAPDEIIDFVNDFSDDEVLEGTEKECAEQSDAHDGDLNTERNVPEAEGVSDQEKFGEITCNIEATEIQCKEAGDNYCENTCQKTVRNICQREEATPNGNIGSSAAIDAKGDSAIDVMHSYEKLTKVEETCNKDETQDSGIDIERHSSMSRIHSQESVMESAPSVDVPTELKWVVISGGGCIVDTTAPMTWFLTSHPNSVAYNRIEEGSWRWLVLRRLQERRIRETAKFEHYERAVERSSWVKVGRMQYLTEGRRRQWVDCTTELEKELDGKGIKHSKFTCHYTMYGKPKHIQYLLSEITCVLEVNNADRPAFGIYTGKRVLDRKPIKIRGNSHKEVKEWIAATSLACCEVRGIHGAPPPRAAWFVSCRGDVFVHETLSDIDVAPSSRMFWRQIGGHMSIVETCAAGIVWGIGMDHTPWVYTGGYGGGIFKGIDSSTVGINTQTDTKNIYIYENQRWNPIEGFSYRGFPTDRYTWSNESGRQDCSMEKVNPPSQHWNWITDWTVDFNISGGTDPEGWQYSRDFKRGFHKEKNWRDVVRRRRWVRKCQLVTTGPWQEAGHMSLLDISLQTDIQEDWHSSIALWAVATNGDVITRLGVTKQCPKGVSWQHIPTDQPFQAITVGCRYQIWGLGRDGSAFYRNGVTQSNPVGTMWFHVPAPSITGLKHISAGVTAVFAIDSQMNLWYRQDVTPTFPEGTKWIHVCQKIRKVSVGPKDQVWILADYVEGGRGVICRREGITPSRPGGSAWDKGAGGGITHLSIRGCTKESGPDVKVEDIAKATIYGTNIEEKTDIPVYTSGKDNALC
ncbi:tectonin beta-propeller repeat-containing protein 1-like isoform X2 [Anneissia japonica]|uniref:tectonin beta-propeller repeat-containing protein 1-like isoform X2 n=1 Tax=Anneissia japonica TaxID=1529436 RepID=UPI00142567C2|nr:tectonin beta-propeller repeat-containing protein 1-like isoform X2 [Anneissia japonica]